MQQNAGKLAFVLGVAVLMLVAALPAHAEHGGGDIDAACSPDGHLTLTKNVDALVIDIDYVNSSSSTVGFRATVNCVSVAVPVDRSIGRRRLERAVDAVDSLLVKIQGASRDLSGGQTASACGKLDAFINEVQAQSGKKVPASAANDLIAAAQQIRIGLVCP
jgi:hypothetical protein